MASSVSSSRPVARRSVSRELFDVQVSVYLFCLDFDGVFVDLSLLTLFLHFTVCPRHGRSATYGELSVQTSPLTVTPVTVTPRLE